MADAPLWRYYAAVLASLVSTLAYIGTLLAAGYLVYAAAAGASSRGVTVGWVVLLLGVGVVFARLEHTLYDTDGQ